MANFRPGQVITTEELFGSQESTPSFKAGDIVSTEQIMSSLQPSTIEQKAGSTPTRSGLMSLVPTKEEIPELVGSMAGMAARRTPAGMALSAGGAAIGEGVRQAVFEDQPLTPKERAYKIFLAAARGGGGELGGRAVGKLFSPFAKSFTPEAQAANKLAVREGMEVPVSNLTESKAVQMTERALEYSPFGGAITRQKQAALGKFKEFADKVGEKIGADIDPVVTGSLAKEQTVAFKAAYDEAKDKLYNAVMPALKNQPVDVGNTTKTLEDIIERRSGEASPQGLDQIKKWLTALKSKKPNLAELSGGKEGAIQTFGQLKQFRANVGARGKFNDPAISGLTADLSELYGAISRDLDKAAGAAGEDIALALKQADEFYATGKNTLKSKVYKALVNAPQDKMHKIAFVPKSSMQYDMVKDIVGQDVMKDISGQWYNEIIKKSSPDGVLSPRKLMTELDRYDGTLQKLASDFPEVGEKFAELKQVAGLLNRGRDVATGSQTTPSAIGIGALLTNIAASIGLLFTNPSAALTAAGVAGAQVGTSGVGVAGIKSKLGREFLTEGFPKVGKFAGRVAKVGGQLGLQKVSE